MHNPDELDNPHYICNSGCGSVSNEEGAKCRTLGCFRVKNPLTECRCKDGKHTKVLKFYNPNGIRPPRKRRTQASPEEKKESAKKSKSKKK